MADVNKILEETKEKVKDVAEDVAYKVRTYDYEALMDEIKGLDVGVAYTKALDALAALDFEAKKQAIIDFLDSPQMDVIKDKGRTVMDFMGYIPYYAQSVPTMVEEAVSKKKKNKKK